MKDMRLLNVIDNMKFRLGWLRSYIEAEVISFRHLTKEIEDQGLAELLDELTAMKMEFDKKHAVYVEKMKLIEGGLR